MRFIQIIVLAVAALVCALAPARADKRVALVIGNSHYQHVGLLPNPASAAAAMAALFKSARFDVVDVHQDLGVTAMRRAVSDFSDKAQGSDIAVVYYAGHGIEVDGVNYLIPVDAVLARDFDVEDETVSLDRALRAIDSARRLRLVIIDACRSNPFIASMRRGSRAIGRGLSAVEPSIGNTLIAYAAKAGSTAADGDSDHSPFTAALLKHIATPGRDIRLALGEVRDAVLASTSQQQEPFVYGSLGGREIAIVEGGSAPPANGGRENPAPGGGLVSEAAQVWETVKNATDIAVIDRFLQHYGAVPFYGDEARGKRAELQKLALLAPPPRRDGEPLTADQARGLKKGDTFRECANCPEMVVVPSGSFTMGSPTSEPERQSDEGPSHTVSIRQPFAMGKFHVTRDEFAAFANDTGFSAHQNCDWRNPGFSQDGSHPVVCVSWDDANAYVNWLSRKAGRTYRLPSEAEFEYAARAGTTTPFWWGSSITPDQANYDGRFVFAGGGSKGAYRQGTVPVSSFRPNPWGLYNVHGNAWEWMADCYHDSYNGAPSDGSAWTSGSCGARVPRGGSWDDNPQNLRAANRFGYSGAGSDFGFRLARTLMP